APGPGPLAPDETNAVAMAPGILGDEISEIHHPVRHSRQAAPWRGSRHVDTPNAATHKLRKIIVVLLKTDMNAPGRTLAESPAAASTRRAVHSDRPAACGPSGGRTTRRWRVAPGQRHRRRCHA